MDDEDGFCCECGADLRGFTAQLTINGRQVCVTCATDGTTRPVARRPEARDDGR